MLGRLRRALWPRRCPVRLEPAHEIEPDGADYRSTGSDPYFLLHLEGGAWPTKRCEVSFDVLPGTVPLNPVLYLDTGAGFHEGEAIHLAAGGPGIHRQLIDLPEGLRRLRFDPAAMPGPLRLRDVRIVERAVPPAGPDGDARDYAAWVRRYDTLYRDDRRDIAAHIARLQTRPKVSVLIEIDGATAAPDLARTVASLARQFYGEWEACVGDGGADATVRAALPGGRRWKVARGAGIAPLSLATGAFVLPLAAGDVLAASALYLFAAAIGMRPDAVLLFADEDRFDPATGRRSAPRFKSGWSPDAMRTHHAVGTPALIRRDAVLGAGGLDRDRSAGGMLGLLLRVMEGLTPARAHHLPFVLVHRTVEEQAASPLTAVRGFLARQGIAAEVTQAAASVPMAWVCYPLPPEPPLVSVIVPTRDRVELLRRTLDGVLHCTDYPSVELIIVDNESSEADTHAYLDEVAAADARVRVLRRPGPFNYSGLNNAAVDAARGSLIALLNNDLEVIDPGWLREMAGHALRPEVGAVGCKLLYADGTVQHGGVVTGVTGIAGHAFRHAPGTASGYLDRLSHAQTLSAVTGACLVTRRALFLDLGGLDEVSFPVSYNDVDFCLRIGDAGYQVVWTPHAVLYHLESASRGLDIRPDNLARAQREYDEMLRRWGGRLADDPYYNPNLTLADEGFGLAWPPRVTRPWRE